MPHLKQEKLFAFLIKGSAYLGILILCLFFVTLFYQSWLSLTSMGFSFFTRGVWDPLNQHFGSLPFLYGTLLTSLLSIFLSLPVALAVALFLGYFVKTGFIRFLFSTMIELLAGIPSVIYGFWALFVLVPLVRQLAFFLDAPPFGVSLLSASLVLAIMIIPYAASFSREVISLVPAELKEAAISLGATRFEVVRYVIFPYAKSGILSGILLSFSRALGETMAVTMVIGNANRIVFSLFEPGNTIASLIANEFAEATSDMYISALMQLGFLLLFVTVGVNFLGLLLIKKWKVKS
ncbi:MAG: phosphate ABC transporter permease subunit PstC [bacterium]